MEKDIDRLKYPIGKFQSPDIIDEEQLKNWIQIIQDFPKKIKQEISNLTETEFQKQYRPGGWTIKQIVNHCADSHMNSLIRFKLALTEEEPTIRPYFENLWAELPDSKNHPTESSLKIIEGIHERWVTLLNNMSESDFEKRLIHPETQSITSLEFNTGIYAWHCNHHLAHIVNAKKN